MNDTIKIKKPLEDSNVLINGITKKHGIKKNKKADFSCTVITISCFISAVSNFLSSKRYKWKRS